MQGVRQFGMLRLGTVLVAVLAMASFIAVRPAAAQDTLTITLNELNDSGMSGEATLTDNGDGTTTVLIELDGAFGGHPAHIHQGTCDDLNPNPEYPLEDVDEAGISETDVDVSLSELLAEPFAINIHESATNLGTYVACGNIAGTIEAAAEDEDTGAEAQPATGGVAFLDELNDSGVFGEAELIDNGDGTTTVIIEVEGATGDHPTHIHAGTCEDLDPNPAYPLNDVDDTGYSETVVEVALDELIAGEYAINIHLSAEDLATYVACGEITSSVGGMVGEPGVTDVTPTTGVGVLAVGSSSAALMSGLAALGGALAGAGLFLRRRSARA